MFGMKRGSLGFANLIGIAPRAKTAEGDDENNKPKRKEDESDEDYAKRCDSYAEEHEDDDAAQGKDSKSAKGDEPDGDEDEDGDEPEGDDDPDKDEDEEDEEDAKKSKKSEKKAEARGFAAANARGAKIFGSAEAASNIALAAHLTFNTKLSAEKAIATLKTAGGQPQGLHRRMAAAPQPRIGAGPQDDGNSANAISRSWEVAAAPFLPKSK